MKKKIGKFDSESAELGTYYVKISGGATLLISCVDPDEDDGPLEPGAVEYISIGVK